MHDRMVSGNNWQGGRVGATLIAEGSMCRRCCKGWAQCKGSDNKICKRNDLRMVSAYYKNDLPCIAHRTVAGDDRCGF